MTIHENEYWLNIGPAKIKKGHCQALDPGTWKVLNKDREVNFIPGPMGIIPTHIEEIALVEDPNTMSIHAVTTSLFTGELIHSTRMKTLTKSEINTPSGQAYTHGRLIWKSGNPTEIEDSLIGR